MPNHQQPLMNAAALRYSIAEAAALLKISRATIYMRINQQLLRASHDGRRVFISASEIERYLRACDEAPAPAP